MRFRLIAYEQARYALRYPTATELRRFSIKKIEDIAEECVRDGKNNRTAFTYKFTVKLQFFQNNFSMSLIHSH